MILLISQNKQEIINMIPYEYFVIIYIRNSMMRIKLIKNYFNYVIYNNKNNS